MHVLERRLQLVAVAAIALAILWLSACNGGGNGISGPALQNPHIIPNARTLSLPLPQAGVSNAGLPGVGGFTESISFPANNATSGTALTLTISTRVPGSMPVLAPNMFVAQRFLYITLTSNKTVTLDNYPSFIMKLPEGVTPEGQPVKMGYYGPADGWNHIGDLTLFGSTATFTPLGSKAITLNANVNYYAITYTCVAPSRLYVPNYSNSTITEYDQNGNRIATSGTFPHLDVPYGIAFDESNKHLYVTNNGNSTVTEYDKNGNEIKPSGTFPNLNSPIGIAFDSSNDHLYVTNTRLPNTITVYDQNGNQITTSGTFPNLDGPAGIAFDSSNGHLYVANSLGNAITVYDQNGNQIKTSGPFRNLNNPLGIAFDSSSCHLYVVNQAGSYVTEYDQNGNQITPSGTFPNLGLLPYGIAFDSSNRHLYVDNVYNDAIAEYDQNGNQITPSGTFPGLHGPTLLTAVP